MGKVKEYTLLIAKRDKLQTEKDQLFSYIKTTTDTQTELFRYKCARYKQTVAELEDIEAELALMEVERAEIAR